MSEEVFPTDPAMVVDVDNPSTWPSTLGEHAQMLADQLLGSTEYTNDLDVPLDDEDDFRALLTGWLVRAFHATRLLDHEVRMIRAQGLRSLSKELVKERIDAAFDHSCISEDDRDQLHASHVYATGEEKGRGGETSLFFPERYLTDRAPGFEKLLTWWGGEAFSKSKRAATLPNRVRCLGKPSIVVASIDLSAGQQTHAVYPLLSKVFVGRLLELTDARANVHFRTAIPPHDITAVWRPGDAEYDRFGDLPTS